MGRTVDAHPGTALSVKSAIHKESKQLMNSDTKKKHKSHRVIKRKGVTDKELIPFHAKDNIFLSGYFEVHRQTFRSII